MCEELDADRVGRRYIGMVANLKFDKTYFDEISANIFF